MFRKNGINYRIGDFVIVQRRPLSVFRIDKLWYDQQKPIECKRAEKADVMRPALTVDALRFSKDSKTKEIFGTGTICQINVTDILSKVDVKIHPDLEPHDILFVRRGAPFKSAPDLIDYQHPKVR